jgi:glucose-1-phosphate thymidylyltransferase
MPRVCFSRDFEQCRLTEETAVKAVILAAGKGTRLYPITRHIPKPLLPLANRPTIFYAFDRLKEMGVRDICVVVGENEAQMRAELGDGASQDVSLTFVRQEEPKGLAHAVGYAQTFAGEDPFVLYLGDAIYGSSFEAQAKLFLDSGAANLNIVKPVDDPRRFGVANVDGDRIVKLVEKPANPESNLAMAGMYFFGPQLWSVLPHLKPSGRGEYEITDAIQMMIDRGDPVLAGIYEGVWFDTGTLDSFLETSAFLTRGETLIGEVSPNAIDATLGNRVVIGDGATVQAESIEDSVILPGAEVHVEGSISRCILAGKVHSRDPLKETILYGT